MTEHLVRLSEHERNAATVALADTYRIGPRDEQQNAADGAYYALLASDRFNNHEADVLCCVPLTLAEAVQAIKDALVPDDRRAFELARQALVAKADAHRDRDPELTRTPTETSDE